MVRLQDSPDRKKYIIPVALAIFCILLFFTVISLAGQIRAGQEGVLFRPAPVNPDFEAYRDSVAREDLRLYTGDGDHPGYFPRPWDSSHLREPVGVKGSLQIYPAAFDLRDEGRVTPVGHQQISGPCWTFATYASLESCLLPGVSWDFSENNMKNTHGFVPAHNQGGTDLMAAAYLTRWSGPVEEADDQYDPNSGYSPPNRPVQKHVQQVVFLPSIPYGANPDWLKQAIMEGGAVFADMYWIDTAYQSTSSAYYYSGSALYNNHAVAIAGWDDNYSRTNFKSTPPGDGAFIVKNSWGTAWGENGYFYLSYYDSNFGVIVDLFHNAEPLYNYNRIYQYDPLGFTQAVGISDTPSTTFWGANIFTAAASESLAAVSFYALAPNTAFEIRIRTGMGASNPAGGTLRLTQTGTLSQAGYHTVILNSPVSLTGGQRFSVIVKFTTPGLIHPLAVEAPLDGYANPTASAGQSFISADGSTWYDLISYMVGTNACIKAFAVTPVTITVSASPPDGGSVNGGGSYNRDAPVTVRATPHAGYKFVNWTEGGTAVSTGAVYTFIATANRNLVANFSREKLPTPAVTLSNRGEASWSEVTGAAGYTVELYKDDSELVETYNAAAHERSKDFQAAIRAGGAGDYHVTVVAAGSGSCLDSDPGVSNTLAVAGLDAPLNPHLSGAGLASWAAVEGAAAYRVNVYRDGGKAGSRESSALQVDLLDLMRAAPGVYSFTVSAMAAPGTLVADSPASAASNPQTVSRLAKPGGLLWNAETLHWNDVAGASGYLVQLYKGGVAEGDPVTGESGAAGVDFSAAIEAGGAGFYTATVQAKGELLYLDGEPSGPSPVYTRTGPLSRVGRPSLSDSGVVSWADVAGATGFAVTLYSGADTDPSAALLSRTVEPGVQECNLRSEIRARGPGTYVARVQALGDWESGGLFEDGPPSEVSNEQAVSVLEAPAVSFSEQGLASWTAVTGATCYFVVLFRPDGTEESITTAALSIDYLAVMRQQEGDYYVTVQAQDQDKLCLDSPPVSSAVQTVVRLPRVDRPVLDAAGKAGWINVADAAYYTVTLYKEGLSVAAAGVPQGSAGEENSYDFLEDIRSSGDGSYTVTVTARGTGLFLDGEQSLQSAARAAETLARVDKPAWEQDGLAITWVDVPGADHYRITLSCFNLSGARIAGSYVAAPGEERIELGSDIDGGFYRATVQARGSGIIFDGPVSPASNIWVHPLRDAVDEVYRAEAYLLFADLLLLFEAENSFTGELAINRMDQYSRAAPAGKIAAEIYLELAWLRGEGLTGLPAYLEVYYNQADLPARLDTGSLLLYRYNSSANRWDRVTQSGASTRDSCVWASLSGFSVYGVFGETIAAPPEDDSPGELPATLGYWSGFILLGVSLGLGGTVLYIRRRAPGSRRRRYRR